MIIKKKVTKTIKEHVLVNKSNAKDVLKCISKRNPHYKFVKALSEGHDVLFEGTEGYNWNFCLSPDKYTIKTTPNWIPWTEKTAPKYQIIIRLKKELQNKSVIIPSDPMHNNFYNLYFEHFEWAISLEGPWKVCGSIK